MTEMEFYFWIKNVLCKYGAIPLSEKSYIEMYKEMYQQFKKINKDFKNDTKRVKTKTF